MSNTFKPLANAGTGVAVAKFPTFTSVAAPVIPPPSGQTYKPINPLPGNLQIGYPI